MREAVCKSCGAAIAWIRTPGGKSMPCDATPRYYIQKPRSGSKKIVTPNGEVISCEYGDARVVLVVEERTDYRQMELFSPTPRQPKGRK